MDDIPIIEDGKYKAWPILSVTAKIPKLYSISYHDESYSHKMISIVNEGFFYKESIFKGILSYQINNMNNN